MVGMVSVVHYTLSDIQHLSISTKHSGNYTADYLGTIKFWANIYTLPPTHFFAHAASKKVGRKKCNFMATYI